MISIFAPVGVASSPICILNLDVQRELGRDKSVNKTNKIIYVKMPSLMICDEIHNLRVLKMELK